MLAAVLDTCVIYSGLRRDYLMSLAAVGVFRLVLTDDILYEIQNVEARKLQDRDREPEVADQKAAWLTGQLRKNFEVEDERRVSLVKPVGLPDPDDEHIVAAALVGGAEVIVTDNTKDFPLALLPAGIRIQDPVAFLVDMVTAHPQLAAAALNEMAGRRRHPPQSEDDILDLMLMRGLADPATVSMLRRVRRR